MRVQQVLYLLIWLISCQNESDSKALVCIFMPLLKWHVHNGKLMKSKWQITVMRSSAFEPSSVCGLTVWHVDYSTNNSKRTDYMCVSDGTIETTDT